jgi:aspartate kinase
MSIIVQKFGGTSVGSVQRIKNAALRVKSEVEKGNQVVVIVSAMSGVTDELVSYVNEISSLITTNEKAEYDSVVCSGEQVTSGLFALALQSIGINARSWFGWQLPIKTDKSYNKARIEEINTSFLYEAFSKNEVAVIAGFQGINSDDRLTTLGRGGSDTSAVAIAAALKAERCDIYTDVEGVYTTDPRIVPKAKKLKKISYEEMLEMASLGAKVLQTRSVEMAMKHHVPVRVLSSFAELPGTLVVDEDADMEKKLITGIAYSRSEARITLRHIPDKPSNTAAIFGPLADAEINVDMIVQNVRSSNDDASVDITFTIDKIEVNKAVTILESFKEEIGFQEINIDSDVAKVSIVGVGMRSHSGVAKLMFQVLADKGINIIVISTSEIKISVLISAEYMELAVRALHVAFELDK